MKFPPLIPAVFKQRVNRFTAVIQFPSGENDKAFVPTTGRLTGVLIPGCRVWLEAADPNTSRKTRFTLVLAELPVGGYCCVRAIQANKLFGEAVKANRLGHFVYEQVAPEVGWGNSRFDFCLSNGEDRCWVEVKSVTFAENGIGKFPDAPSDRARKHLNELAKLSASGDRACVVFVAQREDVDQFTPYAEIDPLFAETLRAVHDQGVEIFAYNCLVRQEIIQIDKKLNYHF